MYTSNERHRYLGHSHNRYMDYSTGRWMSIDPLGVNPNGGIGNKIFNPITQTTDGANLYEYVQSNSVLNIDPYGLASSQVCCKIKETKKVTKYMLMPGAMGSYPVTRTVTSCTQNTIPNPRGYKPSAACQCRYRGNPNIKVDSTKAGPCRWCDVYVVQQKSKVAKDKHFAILVDCDSSSYTLNVAGTSIFGSNTTVNLTLNSNRKIIRAFLVGRISWEQAEDFKGLGGQSWRYNLCAGGNCINFARGMARTMVDSCPK